MSVQTVPQHVRVAAHQRPSVFLRAYITVGGWCHSVWGGVRAVLTLMSPPPAEDESYESGAGWPAAAPTAEMPRIEAPRPERPAPGHPVFPDGQTVHPPFAHQPAFHTHVAIRMQRILVEASWDPELTPSKLWQSLNPVYSELQDLVKAEYDQRRRMERNQQATAAQRVLLDDALHGADPEAIVAQAAASMAARAKHVGSPEDTGIGVIPRITADMPDPRTAEPEPVEAAPEPAVEVEPDRPWTPGDADTEAAEIPAHAGRSLGARIEFLGDDRAVLVAPCGAADPRVSTPVLADVTCEDCLAVIHAEDDVQAEAGSAVAR